MQILAKKEGRKGVWLVEKENIIAWLAEQDMEAIHNFIPKNRLFIGADWDKEEVIQKINISERVAVLTGEAKANNLGHALSVIENNELYIFDIGDITDSDIKDVDM